MIVNYSVNNMEFTHEVSDGYCLTRKIEQENIAESCADHFHSYHDGWEYDWPLTIKLHDPATQEVIAELKVERESEPVFSAHHVKKPK